MPNTKIVDAPLRLGKSTKGTHVLENDNSGLSFYVPKLFFQVAGVDPSRGSYHITIEHVAESSGKAA